jgi:hypothetical protein
VPASTAIACFRRPLPRELEFATHTICSGRESLVAVVSPPTLGGKKTEPTETRHRRRPGNKAQRKPKAEKLVCRYCGSDDLAPSFIKRRDRRCRKCLANRYGSAARAKTTSIKK